MIIHSAAVGARITSEATMKNVAEINIRMFYNLADFVSEKCKMIVFGSGAEYGKQKSLIRVNEKDFGKIIPTDP